MWVLEPTDDFLKSQRKWPKKYHRELANMFDNLSTLQRAFEMGATPQLAAQAGYVHAEPAGVLAIDQSGPGAGLKQARLYVYPDTDSRVLHLITIGDKSSQKADIRFSKEFVESLLDQKGKKPDAAGG